MPLHTNTANFAPSSTLQEILLAYRLNSNDPPFAHLFVLIIFEPISHIYATHATHTSYFTSNTQRKVYHSSPLHTYKVQIHIHCIPLHLKHCISIHIQTYKRSYNSNSPFLHLCLLIICEIVM